MLKWLFGKKTPVVRPAGVPLWVPVEIVDAVAIVLAYWRANADEKKELEARESQSLPWHALLRLHHLNCVEALETGSIRHRLESNEFISTDDRANAALDRCRRSAERLLAPDSPYRPRDADVWHGEVASRDRKPVMKRGVCSNASLTHLGCLEVIRLDEAKRPKLLDFVAFDDLQSFTVAGTGFFRTARLFYDDGRADETVLLPLLYATSWHATSPYLQDGRMTQFIAHPHGNGPAARYGLGVGQQDLVFLEERGESLCGFGTITRLIFALDPTDPRFVTKCQARGLDPDDMLRAAKQHGT